MRSIVGVQDGIMGRLDVLDDPAGHPRNRERFGYVTQAASVYDNLTIREKPRFFAAVLDTDTDAIDRAMEAVDLHERDLSCGQRSRVSLAAALLRTPGLLVLDEPTVGPDPVLRVQLWRLFRKLADGGSTLVVSSHVMDEAEHCDLLLLMRAGELVAATIPTALKTETGCDTIESAFLQIIR